MSGCFCKAVAGNFGPDSGVHKIDKPNPRPLPAGEWVSVNVKYPSLVVCTGVDPGGHLVAVPEMEKGTVAEVYTSIGAGADRALLLPVPGEWRIRNTGAVPITGLVLDLADTVAGLFYGGVKIGGGLVNVAFTPGTFTPTHDTEEVVDAASEQVLAAGAYKHVYFRNTSTGGQRITLCGNNVTAVDGAGWILGSTPLGFGDVISWNHPDVIPIGPFNAISSAAGGKLCVSAGT